MLSSTFGCSAVLCCGCDVFGLLFLYSVRFLCLPEEVPRFFEHPACRVIECHCGHRCVCCNRVLQKLPLLATCFQVFHAIVPHCRALES